MSENTHRSLSVLEYAPPPNRSFLTTTALIAVSAAAVSFLNSSLTCCMCGYQDLISMPGNLLGMALAIWAFARHGGWGDRALAMLAPIFCAIILASNVHNILWSGHSPLLP